jgi:hypothetical protein
MEYVLNKQNVINKVDILEGIIKSDINRFNKKVRGEETDNSFDRLKIVFHKTRFSLFLAGQDELIFPITADIWPSLTCDARCSSCTYINNRARQIADNSSKRFFLDTNITYQFFESFQKAGGNSIIVTGGGEPLLHPDIKLITRNIRSSGLAWGMFTHGLHLDDSIADGLLENEPRFIRISFNAGSSGYHHSKYRLGREALDKITKNTVRAAIKSGKNKVIGVGFALPGSIHDHEILSILDRCTKLFEDSKGTIRSIAFRPEIISFSNQQARNKQPNNTRLESLAYKLHEQIVQPLKTRCGNELTIELKTEMFSRTSKELTRTLSSVATPWATATDHLLNGYIMTELNGSPWNGVKYGSFKNIEFSTLWMSDKRINIMNNFASGSRLIPISHKLSHIDEYLSLIRESVGIMNEREIRDFYKRLEHINFPIIRHWDFL